MITNDDQKKLEEENEATNVKIGPIIIESPPAEYSLPEELFTYLPAADIIHRKFNNGQILRQIFMNIPLAAEEHDFLTKFQEYCDQKRMVIPKDVYPFILRILWYNARKYQNQYLEKSYIHLKDMILWRSQYFPIHERDMIEKLRTGVLYFCGRDTAMRPLMIIRLERMPKSWPPSDLAKLSIFAFEYALRYLLYPGKVETCCVLADLKNVSLFNAPIQSIKEVMNLLTKQYPFRLHKMYIVNSPWIIQGIWTMVKGILTDVQQSKISFMTIKDFSKELRQNYALWQVEEQYGGMAPEKKVFWPFPLLPGPFFPAGTSELNSCAMRNCHEAISEEGSWGTLLHPEKLQPKPLWTSKAASIVHLLDLQPTQSMIELDHDYEKHAAENAESSGRICGVNYVSHVSSKKYSTDQSTSTYDNETLLDAAKVVRDSLECEQFFSDDNSPENRDHTRSHQPYCIGKLTGSGHLHHTGSTTGYIPVRTASQKHQTITSVSDNVPPSPHILLSEYTNSGDRTSKHDRRQGKCKCSCAIQ